MQGFYIWWFHQPTIKSIWKGKPAFVLNLYKLVSCRYSLVMHHNDYLCRISIALGIKSNLEIANIFRRMRVCYESTLSHFAMGNSRTFVKSVLSYTQVKCVWSKIYVNISISFFFPYSWCFTCRKSLPRFQHGFTLASPGELFIKMLSPKDTDWVELGRRWGQAHWGSPLSNSEAFGELSIVPRHMPAAPASSQGSTFKGPVLFIVQTAASFCSHSCTLHHCTFLLPSRIRIS